MKEITRINHVGLRIKDLKTSRAFYEQLGFKFIAGPVGPEPVAIMEHPSGININFILNASPASTTNKLMDEADKFTGYTHIALEVTDIDAVQKNLRELAMLITEGSIAKPDGSIFLFIRDPDSNVIEFHQPAG